MRPRSRSRASSDPAAESASAELDALRREIDALDDRLLAELNERARLGLEVGRLKARHGLPIYSAARERDVIGRLREANPGPFPNDVVEALFARIISATRALEQPLRVAYMGPPGTFSHLAVERQFGASADTVATPSVGDVFAAVAGGAAEYGVVPVENTTEGVVTETLDRLAESELTLCAELMLRISHDLLSRSGEAADIARVVSHPQPLAQCRGWLDRNLHGTPREAAASTAAAAQQAAEDTAVAAVASPMAAATYGLQPVARGIEDHRDNTTRFLVIGRAAPAPSGSDLTSAVFTARKDQPGALHQLLQPFADRGVNVLAIQTRPLKGQPWQYLFFLDLEGHPTEENVAAALAEAGERALSHRVLGAFPRAARSGVEGEVAR